MKSQESYGSNYTTSKVGGLLVVYREEQCFQGFGGTVSEYTSVS
jgi:hypothetical protein